MVQHFVAAQAEAERVANSTRPYPVGAPIFFAGGLLGGGRFGSRAICCSTIGTSARDGPSPVSKPGVIKVNAVVTPRPMANPASDIRNDFVINRDRRPRARRSRAGRTPARSGRPGLAVADPAVPEPDGFARFPLARLCLSGGRARTSSSASALPGGPSGKSRAPRFGILRASGQLPLQHSIHN